MERRGTVVVLTALAIAVTAVGLGLVLVVGDAGGGAASVRVADGGDSALELLFDAPAAPPPPAEPASLEAEDLSSDRAAFEDRFPDQAAAVPELDGDRWALLIGINEHLGAVADNHGSRQDAEQLHELLVGEGWPEDRIVMLTDREATGSMIREGFDWLARKSDQDATVVFHYAGHSKKWYGPGGGIEDQALWPTDDDFVRRDELAVALDRVEHDAFWGNVAACEAAGFHLDGVAAPGRVWTYSSAADEKSYEDPEQGLSVWGMYFLERELARADVAVPVVQDAFDAAAADAHVYTSLQVPYGPQTPVLVDDLGRPFELTAGRETVDTADEERRPVRVTPVFGTVG